MRRARRVASSVTGKLRGFPKTSHSRGDWPQARLRRPCPFARLVIGQSLRLPPRRNYSPDTFFIPAMYKPRFRALVASIATILAPAVLFANAITEQRMEGEQSEPLPKEEIVSLEVIPAEISLRTAREYAQMVVTAKLKSGGTADVTRFATFTPSGPKVSVSATGVLRPESNGAGKLQIAFAGSSAEVPLLVAGADSRPTVDFIRDVNPVMTKVGCNAGTCHGAKEGKVGFKLSLRGYDPLFDVRSLKDDLAGRRLNVASPDDSLMLLKGTGGVPHEGGQRVEFGDRYYEVLRSWIADGAKLNLDVPRVASIQVTPQNPVVQDPGSRQQFCIVATYTDGAKRDVTQEAFVESGNGDVAAVVSGSASGLVKTLRRGEAPVLARYEGAYAATTLTVMGDRSGFVWEKPETWSRIDELVAGKWERMKINPSGVCSDADFLRRVYLDLTGLPPNADQVRAFLSDVTPERQKREAIIEKLIGSPEFVEHWTNKWADLLQVNSKFLGGQGAIAFRDWIKQEVATNTPYDVFVQKIVTATGSNKANPPASYWKILREPAEAMENSTHLFLATRFNCNKCHDHPFERWTEDQYYTLGAYFSRVSLAEDPASNGARIGGTAVEGSKALYEIVGDKTEGEMVHLRTNKMVAPKFPYPAAHKEDGTRREQLAAWLTSADNRFFASSYVNRLWGYLMGVGLIEPLDDIRAGNPASNPELLDYLTKEFVNAKFDVRHVLRLITKSRVYQLGVATNRWNEDDKINYSHALARRLPAEVLYDAVLQVTGAPSRLPGGVRAAMLSDAQQDLPSGFLANAGRPVRESACECERSSELRLGSVMALLSGPAVSDAIGDPANALAKLAKDLPDDRALVNEIFTRVLNRPAKAGEIDRALAGWAEVDKDHAALLTTLEAKEKEQAPFIAKAEQDRLAAIEGAKKELARYEAEIAPRLAAEAKKRDTDAAAAAKALAEYKEKGVAAAQPQWENTAPVSWTYTGWQPLDIVEAKATNGIELVKLPDGSYKATGGRPASSDYVIKADTKLAGITGIMLEVMTLPEEVKFGPGRAPDGNFVLTEIGLKVGDAGTGANPANVKFTAADADFNQANFEVAKAIDGKRGDGNNGWAVSPQTGQPHFAAFTLEKAVGDAEKGARLRIDLHQPRPGSFAIGRFRLWVTSAPGPVKVGYPQAVVEALRKAPATRSDADKAALATYWKDNDPEVQKRQNTHAALLLPPPIDPGVTQRRDAIASAELPIKIDAKLVQLRADAEQSKAQLANRRVTNAQDLTWALVNTPAFLFNR